jgi:hypothetical protein
VHDFGALGTSPWVFIVRLRGRSRKLTSIYTLTSLASNHEDDR